MYYIAVYDVGEKRVGKMLKIFRKYLHHIQNSVFEGELTDADFLRLKIEVKKLYKPNEDSVIFFSLTGKYLQKEVLGEEKRSPSNFI
ncbi:CRISPR-associated endonuclease Cas2 [Chloroherpeton thalassium]|nr:CRISPR-associated endonuclease Cas2 [Chloroherpeton thalassium]